MSSFQGADHEAYFGSTLGIQIYYSIAVVAGLAIVGGVAAFTPSDSGVVSVVWALSAVIGFILLREFIRKTCFAHLNYRTALILDSVVAVLQISGLLVVASMGWMTAARSFMVIGVVTAVAGLAWLSGSLNAIVFSVPALKKALAKNWSLGKWLLASTLLWESNILLYPWLLAAFHGTASTGVWAAGFGVVSMANPLLLGMQNLVGPRMAHTYAEGGKKALDRYLVRATLLFTGFVAPLAVFLFLFADWVIVFVYGAEYTGRGIVIMPLAVDLLLAPALFAMSRALVVVDRAKLDFLTNWISLIVFLSIGIQLAESYSYFGVALGVAIGKISVTIAKFIVYVFVVKNPEMERQMVDAIE